jgi:hypothetical protein
VEPRGNEDDRQGGEVDVSGGEVGQVYSSPHPVVEVDVGSELRQEGSDAGGEIVEQVYPSQPTPSLVRGGRPDSMWM